MVNKTETMIVMDIETRLKEDRDGTLKSEISAGIGEQVALINAKVKNGVPPSEYQELVTLKSGLESSSLALERTWSYYHR